MFIGYSKPQRKFSFCVSFSRKTRVLQIKVKKKIKEKIIMKEKKNGVRMTSKEHRERHNDTK